MNILILFITVGVICNEAKGQWMTVEQFSPSELANLTRQQEHELMLRAMANKGGTLLASAFYFELLSKSIGHNFYGLPQERHATRENNAVIKASLESIKRLFLQDRIESIITQACLNAVRYVRTFGSYPLAFSSMCSDLDFFLKNETSYTVLRDKYKNESLPPPSKIYHYGLAKSLEDENKMVDDLLNEPNMKLLLAHHAWVWINHSYNATLKNLKNSIITLANIPDKLEQVQQIYEQTVEEVVPLMKRVDHTIFRSNAKKLYFDYFQRNLTERLWTKIIQNIPDWKDYFECDSIIKKNNVSIRNCRNKPLPQGNYLILTIIFPHKSQKRLFLVPFRF